MMSADRILVAEIVRVHGVRGLVRLRSFVENEEILTGRQSFFTKEDGDATLGVTIKQSAGNGFYLAAVDGVDNRTDAENYRQTKLYIPRDDLPEADDDAYYHIDLIGLSVQDENGKVLGSVVDVANYGASDLLEIKPEGGTVFLVPFTDAHVPEVTDEYVVIRDYEVFI